MPLGNPSPESLFGNSSRDILRRSAARLLSNYSNPWDPIAEGVQNSVDGINRKYRSILAERISVNKSELEDAVEIATQQIVKDDFNHFKQVSYSYEGEEVETDGLEEGVQWGDPEYQEWIGSRYYDLVAEALGIDADELRDADEEVRESYTGKITVKRDAVNRGIIIEDNGIGMGPEELGEALKRYGSFKSDETRISSEIGELGNGLTYLLTNCNEFRIETSDGEHVSWAEINSMLDWVNKEVELEDVETSSNSREVDGADESYTRVEMFDIREGKSDYPDLFDEKMASKRVVHMIRNKTAIGQLFDAINYPAKHTLREDEVTVQYVELKEPDDLTMDVEFYFEGPTQVAEKAGNDTHSRFPPQLTLAEAKEKVSDKTQSIGEKSVVTRGIWESPGGIKHYYEAIVASRDRYRGLSRKYKYCDDPDGAVQDNKFDLEPGIEIGVKGMPCGSRIEVPASGAAGYWGNLYIMIMNNDLSFDEGREKPATGGRGLNFQDCARHVLFREIGTDVVSGTTKGSDDSSFEVDSDIIDERTADKQDLDYDCLEPIRFKNEPTSEQDVVAIFHECLGSGVFPDNYTGLDTSTWHTYDEIYHYKADPDDDIELMGSMIARSIREHPQVDKIDENIIVEFKRKGEDILTDLSSNKKIYSQIDMLVCWEIDKDKANAQGLTVNEIEPDQIKYWGTTHTMEIDSHLLFDSSNNLYLVELTELFDRLDNGNYNIP